MASMNSTLLPPTLLPPNATELERKLERTLSAETALPVEIRTLIDPATCPVSFLPWLAWQESIDEWLPDWTESEQRAAIAASLYVHAHKGTIGSIRRALQTLGYGIDVIEWFADMPPAAPYTFRVTVTDMNGRGVTETLQAALVKTVERYKNARSQLTGLTVYSVSSGELYAAAALQVSEVITIDPSA